MGGFIFEKVIKLSQNFKASVWEEEANRDRNNPFYPWLHSRI